MLKNFLITSFRSLLRNKSYLVLSTLGLSLGISCVIAIYSIIDFQTGFDQHQKNYNSIYRVVGQITIGNEDVQTQTVPHPLSNAIREELSQVEAMTNTFMLQEQVNIPQANSEVKKIKQNRIAFAYNELYEILSFNWVAGSPTERNDKEAVYLSETTAKKFFDIKEDASAALGRTIILANTHNLVVKGIYEDLPLKTDFPFEMVTHYENQHKVNPYFNEGKIWASLNGGTQCILKLKDAASVENLKADLNKSFEKHNVIEGLSLDVQSMNEIHTGDVGNYSGITFQSTYKTISYTLAVFLAIIGAINFINLTTARAVKRAREVGIRKVLGSKRSDLIFQFLLETFLIVLASVGIGFFLAEQILVLFELGFGLNMHMSEVAISTWIKFIIVVSLGMTLLSGIYPALVLSGFSALSAMKIKVSNVDRQSKLPLRKILVGLQFGFSITLMISAMVIYYQLNYMKNHDTGFDSENIISLRFPAPDIEKQKQLKSRLERFPEFEKVSLHLGSPIARTNNTSQYFNPTLGDDQTFTVNVKSIDENYLELFDLKLLSGRNVLTTDSVDNVIITKLGVERFGLNNPHEALGQILQSRYDRKVKVIGVIDDFNVESLESDLTPVFLQYNPQGYFEMGLKLSAQASQDIPATIELVEENWDAVYPELLIEYEFVSELIANKYRFVDVMGKSTGFFVLIAILISVLGLYGLADYMANAKRKEIGIRKVVGASVKQILSIFAKEISVILIIAFVVSSSISIFLMDKWLNGFEYRISIGYEIVLGALFGTAIVVVMSIGYRSYSAARINPATVLKDE